jgi:CheY-like chemotaxis protein
MLRGTTGAADIPAILLTAYDFSVVREVLEDCNICAVIPKPFSPRELITRVEGILQAGARK